MRLAVAAALLAALPFVASHASAAGRPSGASLVRVLGKQAIPALAPKSSQFGALVRLPAGVSASSLGLDAVAPGIGRLRGAAPSVLAFAGAHPDLAIEVAPPLHTMMDKAGVWTRSPAALHIPNADGTGVVIGIADTGLDVSHPDLRDPVTGKTRVAWLLDLSLAPVGKYPELESTFGLRDADGVLRAGAVLAADDIDAILAAGAPAPTDPVGHGTHVTSIAAGNGGAQQLYVGIAPRATLIIARVTRDATEGIDTDDLVRGVQFLFDRADAMPGKPPMVANLSLGSEFGPHDGTMMWEEVLASFVGPDKPGRALVVAAGNSGSVVETPLHQSVAVTSGGRMRVPIRTTGADDGAVEVWVAMREGADLKVGLDGPDGEWIAPIASGGEQGKNTSDYNAGIINGSNVTSSPIPAASHGAIVVWSGKWPSGAYAITLEGQGSVDLYLQGIGDAGIGGLKPATFAGGVREGTITLPGTHPAIIAVGCTVNRPKWTSIDSEVEGQAVPVLDAPGGMVVRDPTDPTRALTRVVGDGESCWFSSAGPTLTGVPKPEISAPGGIVVAAMSKQAAPGAAGSVFTTRCPSRNGVPSADRCLQVDATHAVSQGTSMSAPMVAGAVALLFERDPSLTQDKLVGLLQAGAHRARGAAPYDDQNGAGELDVLGALDALDQMHDPRLLLPSLTTSWLTLSAQYVAADASTPLTAIVELRTEDGAHRADLFDPARLQPIVKINGRSVAVAAPVRRAPGVWVFSFTPPPGLGGGSVTFGATFDGKDVVTRKSIPIAADVWRASYGTRAKGGCATSGAVPPSSHGESGAALTLVAVAASWKRRRRRRHASSPARMRTRD
jgi:MYXO-CTERM domain-containing protein